MNALIFINWNTALKRAIYFVRFREKLSRMICQELASPDTVYNEPQPKIRVQSGFIPDDYKQPNQNRQSDARQYVRPENTGLMVMSVYEPSLRFGYNAWNKWVYRQARKIVIPNHIKIQMPADEVKIKIS